MFNRYRNPIRKIALFAAFAVFVFTGSFSGICDEPAQSSKPAEKSEAPQPKKNILQYRAYRPSQGIPGAANFNDHLPAPTVATPATPSIPNRRNTELLDREKNWIFLTPGDKQKGDSIENILGIDDITLDGEPKGVVARFLENKQPKKEKSDNLNVSPWERDTNEFGFSQTYGLGGEKKNSPGLLDQSNSLEKGSSTPRTEMSLQELWNERHGPRAEKLREEKQLRMSEFESLFSPRNTTSSSEGLNALGAKDVFGFQPAAAQGGFDLFNRSAPPPVKVSERVAPRNPVGATPSVPTDFNTRAFGPSSTPTFTPEPKKFEAQPAVLPIPKRRL